MARPLSTRGRRRSRIVPLGALAVALPLGCLLTLALRPPALAAPVLQVGVLKGSPPCSDQEGNGDWQGQAVELWRAIASREQLPYTLQPYPSANTLLEATRSGAVDVGVGCLTIAPERVGRYRFSLPFQESGQAVMLRVNRLAASRMLLQALFHPQLLRVVAGYLVVIAALSWLVWRLEHCGDGRRPRREQVRSYALVFQVLASGPGTNVLVSRTRGHLIVLLSWLVRIIGASLIVSTITLEVLQQPRASGFEPRSLADLAGMKVGVRAGSISAQLLQKAPLRGTVTVVPLPSLEQAVPRLLAGRVDAVLADEQQLRYQRNRAPQGQRARLKLVLQGTNRESQAFSLSPQLDAALVQRIDRAISQIKREGLLP